MNPYQIARQLKFSIANRYWLGGGGSNENVFGNVAVASIAQYAAHAPEYRLPVCLIEQLGVAWGPFASGSGSAKGVARFAIHMLADVPMDLLGQASTVGGSRSSIGSSQGRGTTELEAEVAAALLAIAPEIRLNLKSTASKGYDFPIEGRVLAQRTFEVEATCRMDLFYTGPWNVNVAMIDATSFTATWRNPARWDVLLNGNNNTIPICRYNAGSSTPPATPTSGTSFGTLPPGAVSLTMAQGHQTVAYSIFIPYDDNGDGVVDTYGRTSFTVTT